MELVVPDEKLSLAIGRKGQNVRLASQLTGWKLDIISESKFKQMEDEALAALSEIDGVDEDLCKSMYRLGFRALEEIAEAPVDELVTIPGIATPEEAQSLKAAAESSMERLRRERIQRALSQSDALTERDKLRFVRGVGQRTLQLLEEAGYKTVTDLAREDADRLAIRTGLGIKKARQVQQGAVYFINNESAEIEAARAELARSQNGSDEGGPKTGAGGGE
jgi:N utilization substance protein A